MTCVLVLSSLLVPGVLGPGVVGLASVAQTPPPAPASRVAAAPAPAQTPAPVSDSGRLERDRILMLTAGRSMVLTTAYDITRIAITDPKIADAVVVQPREVLIDGRSAGTVSLIVWGVGRRDQYDVVVDPGVTTMQQTLQQLFPGEDIRVAVNDDAVILSGQVSTNTVMLRAAEVVAATKTNARVVNMLQLPGGSASQQVMLQVRFAEVNRAALMQAGFSLFTNAQRYSARTTTQQFAAPDFDDSGSGDGLEFTDFLNLFFYDRKEGIGGVLKALESKGYFQSLAEPNLIAYNGQEASFLAGGEFPIPVVQGSAASNSVTIVFKEFGVRLKFKPTIAGDVIRLKVAPEVSSLDFNNGITLQGFRIPALLTRRAETDVELRDGQSFAIAGLLNNVTQEDKAAIPILSKLPIIGALFKSKSDRAERTELMVLITPRLVRPLDPDEVPPLPTRPKSFLPAPTGEEDAPPPTVEPTAAPPRPEGRR
ncbi:MAG: type II and III secretion system protein family protein [Vicinamibacteraceae bacterium]